MVENILEADLADMKRGYSFSDGFYTCLICGRQTESGVVYPQDDALYEAERYMKMHIAKEHGSVFHALLQLDKRKTGLSEHQSNLLRLFYEGKSDTAIQAELHIGSGATIRAHRFALKEKERQAKVFVVLMELLREKVKPSFAQRPASGRAPSGIRGDFIDRFLKNGRLATLEVKKKNRLPLLKEVVKLFEADRVYTEKEVNEVLMPVYDDFLSLRRYLVDYGLLRRKDDGSAYWIALQPEEQEETELDRRKELIQQYKGLKTTGGVYLLRNRENGRIFVGATPNLKSVQDISVALDRCAFRSAKLKEDIAKYGREVFECEILEQMEEKDDLFFDMADEVRAMEKKWLKKLEPYGEKGYN